MGGWARAVGDLKTASRQHESKSIERTGTVLHFRPRLLDSLAGYSPTAFLADLGAGVTVAAVALPLAMAFAIASGLTPQAGIATGIVAGFLISALGGSRVQIGGPAGAYIVVVYGIVERFGVANLMVATLMAGLLLLVMGLFRVGNLVRYVPITIVIGFTNGIAVVVAIAQIKDFFGLRVTSLPADFFAKLDALAAHLHTFNSQACLLAIVSLAFLAAWPRLAAGLGARGGRVAAAVPGPVIVLAGATAFVMLASPAIDTIGSRFGKIPQALPHFSLPDVEWLTVKALIPSAITLALLGAIESLLCARVADAMINDRHDPNQELMAQGIANMASPLFGGYAATGTIARTVTNVKSGASTPIAGMIHALALLAIVLVAAPLTGHVPMAALAAILVMVAYNMGEWREFKRLLRFSYYYRITLLTTFVLTVVVDLTIAVEVGLLLACLFFVTRMASLTRLEPLADVSAYGPQAEGWRLTGSLFFGAIGKLDELLDPRRTTPPALVLDVSALISLDNTGLEALETLHGLQQRNGGRLVLLGLAGQPRDLAERSGFLAVIGVQNASASAAN
jgi:SulP family sulfate permease